MSGVFRVFIAGAGFLADAYDLFVINVAVDIMSKVSYDQHLSDTLKSTVKTSALIGAVVGQLGFGAVADLIGRKKVFIITCSLVIFGALMSATVQDTETFGIYSQLCLWRFVLGVGVGGEYPLSASITSESSGSESKAKSLASVFSMQGFGSLLCCLVLVTLTQTLGTNYDIQWRIALGLGGLPMVMAFYFRWTMHETEAWEAKSTSTLLSIQDSNKAALLPDVNESTSLTTFQYFVAGSNAVFETVRDNYWLLLGTAGSWFILDIVFYANSLFSGQITKAMNIGATIQAEALSQLILQSLALPGYIATIMFIDRIGILRLQNVGFSLTAVFFFLLAGLQPILNDIPALYIFIYGLTFFFQNFGANATTYIMPAVVFPVKQRATCHGISAAAGKLGAILGAQTFTYLQYSFCPQDSCVGDNISQDDINTGLRVTFAVCGALAIWGLLWSYFLVSDTPADEQSSSSGMEKMEKYGRFNEA